MNRRDVIVVMGPSGCGKSTVAAALAQAWSSLLMDGDDYHPASNIEKMSKGEPLSDKDRSEWIDAIIAGLAVCKENQVVLACSALTSFVQERLNEIPTHSAHFVMLNVPREVLEARLIDRKDHFMPPSLLESQLSALTAPVRAIQIDGTGTVNAIIEQITIALNKQP